MAEVWWPGAQKHFSGPRVPPPQWKKYAKYVVFPSMIVSSKIRFVQVTYSKSPGRPSLHIMLVVLWPNPPNPPFSEYHGPPMILSAVTNKERIFILEFFKKKDF